MHEYAKIPDSPKLCIEIDNVEDKIHGWLVIHTCGNSGSCGGVRISNTINIEEVKALAKAMSYKYAFIERDTGGAKAGLSLPNSISPHEREQLLRKVGYHLSDLLQKGIYNPWTDLNSTSQDIKNIYAGAGIKINDLSDSAYYTALSTFSGVMASAEFIKVSPHNCSITIEGLGAVGKYIAKEIQLWGGKLIGASTIAGAVVNINGLDLNEVFRAMDKHKDQWVLEKGNWEIVQKEDLFDQPMVIHIPCARAFSVNESVIAKLRCKIIAPAANAPFTKRVIENAGKDNKILLPDFVLNAGGILGPSLHTWGSTDIDIREFFLNEYSKMILRLLNLSKTTCFQPIEIATAEANRYYALTHSNIKKSFVYSRYFKIKNLFHKATSTNRASIINAKETVFNKFSDLSTN